MNENDVLKIFLTVPDIHDKDGQRKKHGGGGRKKGWQLGWAEKERKGERRGGYGLKTKRNGERERERERGGGGREKYRERL